MASLQRKAIVIEASLAQIKSPYPESQAHPNAVVGTLIALQERWGIQVSCCDTPELGEEIVAHILSKHYTLQWLEDNRLPRHFVGRGCMSPQRHQKTIATLTTTRGTSQ